MMRTLFKYISLLKISIVCICLLFIFTIKVATADYHRSNYNIVLITICSLSADHLTCYGYSRNTSPYINKLAKEAIIFENAFSNAVLTLESMISIHTSLYPQSHGVSYVFKDILSRRVKTLSEILKDCGYDTIWFQHIGRHPLNINSGFARGFKYIKEYYSFLDSKNELLDWIAQNRDKKFFLSFHANDIHYPYMPSLKYTEKIRVPQTYKNRISSALAKTEESEFDFIKYSERQLEPKSKILKGEINSYSDFKNGDDSKKELKKVARFLMGAYDACILELDQGLIQSLLEQLKQLNLYDRTMIIITADHGEEFGEHGSFVHGRSLYDEIIHIPLIIKLPNGIHYGDKRIRGLVQSIDIMPTILDVLNIPIPEQVQGISLKSLWEVSDNAARNKYVYAITPLSHTISMRSEEYKFIYHLYDNQHELYDLKVDSQEKNNIYEQNSTIVKCLEEDFHEWRKRLFSYIDEDRDFPPEIDDATRKRIMKTGYW